MRGLIAVVFVGCGSSPAPVVDPGPKPPSDAPRCDAAALHRAAEVALTAARTAGVRGDALASCAAIEPTCGDPTDDVDPIHCRIAIAVRDDRYEVSVRPAAIDGAPRSYSAWLALDTFALGNTQVDGARWGIAGSIAVIGMPTSAIHTHGGPAAQIANSAFHVYNRGSTGAHVALRSAAWLHDTQCNLPGDPTSMPEAKLAPTVVPAGGDAALDITFPPKEAYQDWCDRFGVAVELDVDGTPVRSATEIYVARVEPRR